MRSIPILALLLVLFILLASSLHISSYLAIHSPTIHICILSISAIVVTPLPSLVPARRYRRTHIVSSKSSLPKTHPSHIHTVHQKPLPTIFGAIRYIGCPGLNAAPSASRSTLPLGKAATLIMPILYCDLVPQSSIICP